MVVNMNVEKLKSILLEKNKVNFKLYSLDYVIEKTENYIILFSPTYPKDVRKYNNIDELLNDFTVYNQTLFEIDDKVIIKE